MTPILVIGDCMLDKTTSGIATRISPEGPVPVVDKRKVQFFPGGAANVASNISSLGGKSVLIGCIGKDNSANRLISILDLDGVQFEPIRVAAPTTVKHRVYANEKLVLRIDQEGKISCRDKILSLIYKVWTKLKPGVVVLSDYAKGVLDSGIASEIIQRANREGIVSLVDPKIDTCTRYRGASILKPNLVEALHTLGKPIDKLCGIHTISRMAILLRNVASADSVVITHGVSGMTVAMENDVVRHFPAIKPSAVFDVSGAGDTALAAIAVAISEGRSLHDAVEFAVLASGLAVSKSGTTRVYRSELKEIKHDMLEL